jgi:nitrite reductase/ring-hydroxylating ferredoxin subunit
MTTSVPNDVAAPWADQARAYLDATHLAGWASEVARPGDFVTRDLGPSPVLVCRGDDGDLKAFLNVCSHEGARVALGCGTAERFVCGRHGWTYDRGGNVTYRPGAIRGPIKLGGRPLRGLPVLERDGLVLVCPTPTGELDPSAISVPAGIGRDWRALGQRNLALTASWEAALDDVLSSAGGAAVAVGTYATVVAGDDHLLLVSAGPGQLDGETQVALTMLVPARETPPADGRAADRLSPLDDVAQRLRGRYGLT